MPRKAHQYHYIYRTTCTVTGKFYIGMHSCSNLEDGYLGSGKRLRYSINKYGEENHTKTILEFLPDRLSLIRREKEIINQEMLNESLCLNIALGGEGSSDKFKAAHEYWKLPENKKRRSEISSSTIKKTISEGKLKNSSGFKGKSHSNETKKKLSEISSLSQLGDKNSQIGTCWITNGTENKKIKRNEDLPEGWSLGRKIKHAPVEYLV